MKIELKQEEYGPKQPLTSWYLNIGDNLFGHLINDWEQFYGRFTGTRWNWYTFRFLHLEFEKDDTIPGYSLEAIVLGLGFRFRYNSPD